METLALKLILTPALVGGASLAGRRWGPWVSGWLVGVPLTSGPIALFLALDHGEAFAAAAAVGTLAGSISQAAFCVAYARVAARGGGPAALAAATLAFAAATALLQHASLALLPQAIAVLVALLVAWRSMPVPAARAARAVRPPAWDLPARMAIATAFVLALTAASPALGPRLTGLLAPFPLYAAILAAFAHHLDGREAAASVLRGLLGGLVSFAGFFVSLAALIERAGIGPAFAAAAAVTAILQAAGLGLARRQARADAI